MPNLKHNAYRDSLVAHQTTANEYYMDMCGDDGMSNPCSSTTKTISDGAPPHQILEIVSISPKKTGIPPCLFPISRSV